MTKFLVNKFLVLALIVTSAATPMSYRFDQTALFHSVAAVAQNGAEARSKATGNCLFAPSFILAGTSRTERR